MMLLRGLQPLGSGPARPLSLGSRGKWRAQLHTQQPDVGVKGVVPPANTSPPLLTAGANSPITLPAQP